MVGLPEKTVEMKSLNSTPEPLDSQPLETAEDCVLAVHGGAGVLSREGNEDTCRAALEAALRAGYEALQKPGATSLDAVTAAICVLENARASMPVRARRSPATVGSSWTPRSWTAGAAAPAPWHA